MKKHIRVFWPRLPETRKFGERLAESYPGLTDGYEGEHADKGRLMKTDLTRYESIVFASHGYGGTDLCGLKEPVLVLTLVNQPKDRDGFLRMSEVTRLKMNADFVALTTCNSGLGRRFPREGIMGMGRAFQYAGAKSVLLSLWYVPETPSAKLVESFYRHRKAGKSKLEALKLARQEIRKEGYDHPFFWASFILAGEAQ